MGNQADGTLSLTGYDDIFNVGKIIDGERIIEISIEELYPPDFHPFQVNDDAEMEKLVESVKQYGVREPGLARPLADGGYELLCGNRRKRASELAGYAVMPVIIRELTDDEAAIVMVDSNLLNREKILLSEKAWAYRMKLEALNHSGIKEDMLSIDTLVNQTGESKNQIYRLVRLTELIVTLLDKVDTRQIAFNPAVELSYLSLTEQTAVVEAMEQYDVKPSLSQAVSLKKRKQSGELIVEDIDRILSEKKKLPKNKPTGSDRFREFFPHSYSQEQMDAIIIALLSEWKESSL